MVPACEPYCYGYWYDAYGYSFISTGEPSDPTWPSIMYTYPYSLVWVAVYNQAISMTGSGATAWAPPVIYSITPNQWPAGATTTFTITGAGFGTGPELAIDGMGVTAHSNPCASSPSPACDTQIVATVTIDATTPGGMVETITVTVNGQNADGFLPVPIIGQSGQVTSQVTTLPLVATSPHIVLGGGGMCAGNDVSGPARSVQVGQ